MGHYRLRTAKLLNTQSPLYRRLRTAPRLFALGKGIHHAIVSSQVWAAHRVPQPTPHCSLQKIRELVTIVIKTFERPHSLRRLIKSIKTFYGDIEIIVASDSKIPEVLPGIKTVYLPFNSGVSIGRAAALQEVSTPYFVSLDDDFILWGRSDFSHMLTNMEEYGEIDVMGGWLINLPFWVRSGPGGILHVPHAPTNIQLREKQVGPFLCHGKVPQFYMARTERIKEIGWDPRVKVLDHSMFFGRLFQERTVVFNQEVSVLHARTPFNSNYLTYRNDIERDAELFRQEYKKLVTKVR